MIGRDSRGHFIKGNVPWNKRQDSSQKGMASLVVPKVIGGGVLKLARIQVICPACGQQVEAVASDGRVKGYCAVAKQYVDFLIKTQLERKKRWQDPEYRARQIAIHTGKHPTAEHRAKISEALKRRQNKKRGMRVNKDVKNSKVGRLDMPASPVGILPAPVMKIWAFSRGGQWFGYLGLSFEGEGDNRGEVGVLNI